MSDLPNNLSLAQGGWAVFIIGRELCQTQLLKLSSHLNLVGLMKKKTFGFAAAPICTCKFGIIAYINWVNCTWKQAFKCSLNRFAAISQGSSDQQTPQIIPRGWRQSGPHCTCSELSSLPRAGSGPRGQHCFLHRVGPRASGDAEGQTRQLCSSFHAE